MKTISNNNRNIVYFSSELNPRVHYKCAFFDRDGVIINDVGYLSDINDIKFNEGIFNLMSYLKGKNYLLGIITNQSGIGRGYFTEKKFIQIQNIINKKLLSNGINLDFLIACPYFENGIHPYNKKCNFRKPDIGMIEESCKQINILKDKSFLIGDRLTDIQCAKKARLNRAFLIGKDIDNMNLKSMCDDNFSVTPHKTVKHLGEFLINEKSL